MVADHHHHLQEFGLAEIEGENILRKLSHELIEIEGENQDLHHLQQDLDRHGEALSISVNSIKRSVESVGRLIEETRMHRLRREDILNDLKSLVNSLQSNQNQKKIREKFVEERDNVSANSSTTETDEEDKSNDSDAAKILIDLAAKDQGSDLCKEEAKNLDDSSAKESKEQAQIELGCRFTPTDAEIIMFLKNKIAGKSIPVHITEKDLYGNEEPAVLFDRNPAEELFFVTKIKKKFESGRTNNRVVGNGTWKIQNNKNVYENPAKKDKVIGHKRALNFVDEITKRDKISWIMYEYNLCPGEENPERWAICRIKRGKGNRIGLDSLSKSIQNGNGIVIDSQPRPIQNARDNDLRLPDKRLPKANDDDSRLLKKPKVLETMDLSLSLGLPSENTREAPRNVQKDQEQNLFEHSRISSSWGTFL